MPHCYKEVTVKKKCVSGHVEVKAANLGLEYNYGISCGCFIAYSKDILQGIWSRIYNC